MSWVAVAQVDDCKPGKAHIVNVEGKELGILQVGGKFYAVLNYCPHSGAPICRGRVEGRVIADDEGVVTYDAGAKTLRCPWHHWEFDLDTGNAILPMRERIKVYPVRVSGSTVYVKIGR